MINGFEAVRMHIEDMGNAFPIVLASFRVFDDSIDRMFDNLVVGVINRLLWFVYILT